MVIEEILLSRIKPSFDVETVALIRTLPLTVNVPPSRRIPVEVELLELITWMESHCSVSSTVTLNPFSTTTTSPMPGTEAPPAPPEVADQVDVLFQFPVATEYLVAAKVTLKFRIMEIRAATLSSVFVFMMVLVFTVIILVVN